MDGGSPQRVPRTRGRAGQRGGRRARGDIHSRAPTEADGKAEIEIQIEALKEG